MVQNNYAKSDAFTDELMARMQDSDEKGDFYSPDLGDCENVGPIPFSFLVAHGISSAPGGRTYYCTAYGDLYAYDLGDTASAERGDPGVGFNFDKWVWRA